MSDIHSELQREILLRLPAEPLLRFRAVCKSWRRTIDDPSFARSHFINNQRSSPNLLIQTDTGALYSVSLDSLIHINGEQTIDATRVNYLVRRDVAQETCFRVSTCDSNGLILIPDYYQNNKTWLIWNPFTGDFHELPKLDIKVNSPKGFGIGHDSASDDYKVVLIDEVSRGGESVYRTFVYSLRLNSWKTIMDCPFYPWVEPGKFLNGALYWQSKGTIIVLDLATEEYRQLAAMPEWRFPWDTYMDVWDGCLVVMTLMCETQRAWAWVMKDNGVESWVELFLSTERHVIDGWRSKWDWPIAYSKSQLILQHENEILVWDIEKGSAKMVTIHGLPVPLYFQICPISIFRFNDSDGGVQRKVNEANTRLKLSVTTTTDIPRHSDSDDSSGEEDEEEDSYYVG